MHRRVCLRRAGYVLGIALFLVGFCSENGDAGLVGKHTVYRIYAQTAEEKDEWMQLIR